MIRLSLVVITFSMAAVSLHAQDFPPPDDSFKSLDVQPTITSRVTPIYPREAMDQDLEGSVWVKVLITAEGAVQKVDILKSTNKVFDQPAMDAATKFTFTPGYVKNKPVECWVSIPFKWKLAPKSSAVRKNAEELPKTLKLPKVLVVQGPPLLEKTIEYPPDAIDKGIEGAVFVTVTLNAERRISGLEVTRGIGGGCDEKVLQAVSGYAFSEDPNLDLVTLDDKLTASIVVQFVLPAR